MSFQQVDLEAQQQAALALRNQHLEQPRAVVVASLVHQHQPLPLRDSEEVASGLLRQLPHRRPLVVVPLSSVEPSQLVVHSALAVQPPGLRCLAVVLAVVPLEVVELLVASEELRAIQE